jgi:peptide/nickel transport system substrate-binding protein
MWLATSARRRKCRRLGVLASGIAALVLVVAACAGVGSSGNADGTQLTMAMGPWTTWQYNPWSPAWPSSLQGFVYLPLAIQNWPSLTSFTPELAASWSADGNNLIIRLQPDARWQNGAPVTSTDVIDSIYLDGVYGDAIWDDIAAVAAAGQKEVVLTARPGVPMTLLEYDLFSSVTPFPASVWGRYVTPSLKQDVVSYFNQALTNPDAAADSPAGKAVSATLQTLITDSPSTVVGDGPYKLGGQTTQAVEFVKWDGFYDASHITIDQINFLGLQQSLVNSALLSGQADFSSNWLYMPPVIVQQWLHTANAHLLVVPGLEQGEVIFNDHEYPFNETKVRQALAYAFPLTEMDELAWGTTSPHAAAPDTPDGLTTPVEDEFLTGGEINSLNPYHYSPSTAAAMLRAAGFRKPGQWWVMPNGKQFTLTLSINANWTDQIAAFRVASIILTSFGIQTTLNTVEETAYLDYLHNSNFQVAADCCAAAADPDPLIDLSDSPMGSSENFTTSGIDAGQRGIGFGPVATVPGLGTVNITQALQGESQTVGVGSKMKDLTWDWVRFVDEQVPYLQYANFTNQIAYSSNNFDWPSKSNPLWSKATGNANYEIIEGEEDGLIRPK